MQHIRHLDISIRLTAASEKAFFIGFLLLTFKTFYTLALKLRLTARLMLVYKFDCTKR